MKRQEKIKWIIRYIKRNNIDFILNDKYKEAFKFPPKTLEFIQTVCSVISVVVIGFTSINLSARSNELASSQNRILDYQLSLMEKDYNAAIDVVVSEPDDGIRTVKVINRGKPVISKTIDMVSFLNVNMRENDWGSRDYIRCYALETGKHRFYNIEGEDENYSTIVAEFPIYANSYHKLEKLISQLSTINATYTPYHCDFDYIYILRISYEDSLGEDSTNYYMIDEYGLIDISMKTGEVYFDEWNEALYHFNNKKFDLYWGLKWDADEIFRNIVSKMRSMNLYAEDGYGEIIRYGDYEHNR